MFDEFAHSQNFTGETELFLDGIVGGDAGGGGVGAVEVPAVEAGEVLEGTEGFVAADCCYREIRSGFDYTNC